MGKWADNLFYACLGGAVSIGLFAGGTLLGLKLEKENITYKPSAVQQIQPERQRYGSLETQVLPQAQISPLPQVLEPQYQQPQQYSQYPQYYRQPSQQITSQPQAVYNTYFYQQPNQPMTQLPQPQVIPAIPSSPLAPQRYSASAPQPRFILPRAASEVPAPMVVPAPKEKSKISLSGIALGNQKRAIIKKDNIESIVKEGDIINGYTLNRIEERDIILTDKNGVITKIYFGSERELE